MDIQLLGCRGYSFTNNRHITNMKVKLSDSLAVASQTLLLIIFITVNFLVWRSTSKFSITASSLLFDLRITILSALIIFLSLKTADVFLEKRTFIIKNIFRTRKLPLDDFRKVTPIAILGYRIEFAGNRNVYVLFNPGEILTEMFSSKSNSVIGRINSLIEGERNKEWSTIDNRQ